MSTDIIASDNNPRIEVSLSNTDEALQRLRPQLDALEPSALSRLNLDVDIAASRALGAVHTLHALQARIQQDCPNADRAAIAQIEERANALLAAQARYRTAVEMPAELVALGNEAVEARGALAAIIAMLVSCNLLKQSQVPPLTGGKSYRIAASETLMLVSLLKDNWSRFENKVPVTMAQIERLRGVAAELMRLAGERDQMPQRTSDAADLRQRALTLLESAYDEARRVVTFLRWHEGDADQMLPSFRTHAGPSKQDGTDANGTDGTGTNSGAAGAAGATGATGGVATTQSATDAEYAAAMKVFAPPADAKPAAAGSAPNAMPSLPRSKPYADS